MMKSYLWILLLVSPVLCFSEQNDYEEITIQHKVGGTFSKVDFDSYLEKVEAIAIVEILRGESKRLKSFGHVTCGNNYIAFMESTLEGIEDKRKSHLGFSSSKGLTVNKQYLIFFNYSDAYKSMAKERGVEVKATDSRYTAERAACIEKLDQPYIIADRIFEISKTHPDFKKGDWVKVGPTDFVFPDKIDLSQSFKGLDHLDYHYVSLQSLSEYIKQKRKTLSDSPKNVGGNHSGSE